MNYIELINNVWALREQGIITSLEMDLYLYLIHKSNSLNWRNPFNQPTSFICEFLSINRNALIARRNKLKQLGLIDFIEGITKTKSASYTLLCIKKDTQPITQPYTHSNTQPITQPYTKSKLNKTKQNKRTNTNVFVPPSLAEVKSFFSEKGYSEQSAIKAWEYYETGNWKDSKGKQVKNWKQKMIAVWFKDENKIAGKQETGSYIETEKDKW